MASIRRELSLDASAERVWDSVRDFGAVHTRVAPGFVVACTLEGQTRVVTFANGTVARELLVDCDVEKRRLVYAVTSERVSHYNASLEVLSVNGGQSLVIWTVDVLPAEIKDYISRQMDQALPVMKVTLERVS